MEWQSISNPIYFLEIPDPLWDSIFWPVNFHKSTHCFVVFATSCSSCHVTIKMSFFNFFSHSLVVETCTVCALHCICSYSYVKDSSVSKPASLAMSKYKLSQLILGICKYHRHLEKKMLCLYLPVNIIAILWGREKVRRTEKSQGQAESFGFTKWRVHILQIQVIDMHCTCQGTKKPAWIRHHFSSYVCKFLTNMDDGSTRINGDQLFPNYEC